MDFIYIITVIDDNRNRPSNVFNNLEDAIKAVDDNFF